MCVFEPIVKALFLYVGGYPTCFLIVYKELGFDVFNLNEIRCDCFVYQGCVRAPAIWIRMDNARVVDQTTLTVRPTFFHEERLKRCWADSKHVKRVPCS